MDFLFATLPDSNFQMTEEQLILWQRNALFECECDNLINQCIETDRLRHSYTVRRTTTFETAAVTAAISQHGLRRPNSRNYLVSYSPPPAQRARIEQQIVHTERDIEPPTFYQETLATTVRERGLRRDMNS